MLDVIAAFPWPIGIAIGIGAYALIRFGVGWFFVDQGGVYLKPVGEQLLRGTAAPLAWTVMFACWLAAGFSYFRSRQRKRLVDTQTGLSSLTAMSWRQFEILVGEAFRRQGYRVEETGQGGADGGIDLILRKGGRTELVQCKQWRTRQVKANVVREMWGLVSHYRADRAKIVCVGRFTRDAAEFAAGKPIDLITGEQLLDLVQRVQTNPPPKVSTGPIITESISEPKAPTCPKCKSAMVQRTNHQTRELFWGCSAFPKCRGTIAHAKSALGNVP